MTTWYINIFFRFNMHRAYLLFYKRNITLKSFALKPPSKIRCRTDQWINANFDMYAVAAMLFGYDLLSNYSMNILLIDERAAKCTKHFWFSFLECMALWHGVRAAPRRMLLFKCAVADKNSNTETASAQKSLLRNVSRTSTWDEYSSNFRCAHIWEENL